MLKWIVGVGATVAIVWGLVQVMNALAGGTTMELLRGVVGVLLAALSFAYLFWLFSSMQKNM